MTTSFLTRANRLSVGNRQHLSAGLSRTVRRAFTLVELLVVISIIGILMAMLLPAVNAAREAGRRAVCSNNAAQLGKACLTYESKFQTYPCGGWGQNWLPDPTRGAGRKQPGGWVYNILPYIELSQLHDLGHDMLPTDLPAKLHDNVKRMVGTPLAIFACPTRRSPRVYLTSDAFKPATWTTNTITYSAGDVTNVGHGDYAINCGDGNPTILSAASSQNDASSQPNTYADVDATPTAYVWPDPKQWNGISFQRSEIAQAHVQDGSSYVYLLGEKALSPECYDPLTAAESAKGDDQCMYTGFNNDNHRCTFNPPQMDTITKNAKTAEGEQNALFGSAHPSGLNMIMCDGAVRQISYSIDERVHQQLGNRKDGTPPEDQF